jgi:hypothetical protein
MHTQGVKTGVGIKGHSSSMFFELKLKSAKNPKGPLCFWDLTDIEVQKRKAKKQLNVNECKNQHSLKHRCNKTQKGDSPRFSDNPKYPSK